MLLLLALVRLWLLLLKLGLGQQDYTKENQS